VASLLQKHQAPPWVLGHLAVVRIWLTFVTVGELAKWAVVRKWGQDRRGLLEVWTAGRPVIPYDAQIAWMWGGLAGAAQLRGRPRPQNDTCSLIQVIASVTQSPRLGVQGAGRRGACVSPGLLVRRITGVAGPGDLTGQRVHAGHRLRSGPCL
jgi:predicted nucleic acid-binding protein